MFTNWLNPRFTGTATRSGRPFGDSLHPTGTTAVSPGQRICFSSLPLLGYKLVEIPNSGVQNPTVLAPAPMIFTISYVAGICHCPSTSLKLPARPWNLVLSTASASPVPAACVVVRKDLSAAVVVAHAVSYSQSSHTGTLTVSWVAGFSCRNLCLNRLEKFLTCSVACTWTRRLTTGSRGRRG